MRGAWWALTCFDGLDKPPKPLSLHDASRIGPMELFQSDFPGTPLATPWLLTLDKGQEAKAEIVFESARALRVRGRGAPFRLIRKGAAKWVPKGTNAGRIVLGGSRVLFQLLRGSIRLEQHSLGIANAFEQPRIEATDLTIAVEPEARGDFEFRLERFSTEPAREPEIRPFDSLVADRRSEIDRWVGAFPCVSRDPLAALAAWQNWNSLAAPMMHLRREGMLMSKMWMNGIWSWDHAFNAMALAAAHPDCAWDPLLVPFDQQDPETGALPDAIYPNDLQYGFVKQPLHGWAWRKMAGANPALFSRERAAEFYPKLAAWTRFWTDFRDDDGNGLVQVNDGNDHFDHLPVYDVGCPVEDPHVNAMLALQMEVLGDAAEILGDLPDARQWREGSARLIENLLRELWDGEKFTYPHTGTRRCEDQAISPLHYTPLILGKRLPREVRRKSAEGLRISGLLTPHGLLNESPRSPLFAPESYTRGRIWPPVNYLMIEGLRASGERRMADELNDAILGTLRRSGFSECFTTDGEPSCAPSYTWTSSIYLLLCL